MIEISPCAAFDGSDCMSCGSTAVDFPEGLKPATIRQEELSILRVSTPRGNVSTTIRFCSTCRDELREMLMRRY